MSSWSKIWKALITPVGTPQVKEQEQEVVCTQCDANDFESHWLTVHIALATLRELQECGSYHEMPKHTENLRNIVQEIKGLSQLTEYPVIVKKGVAEFNKNWNTKVTSEELKCIEHPDEIDVSGLICKKCCVLASTYQIYWEGAIAGLVRKSAILKRRQYLVEDIDRFINILPVECSEVVNELKKYKAFNQEKVESLE